MRFLHRLDRFSLGLALGAIVALDPWVFSSGFSVGAPLALAVDGGGHGGGESVRIAAGGGGFGGSGRGPVGRQYLSWPGPGGFVAALGALLGELDADPQPHAMEKLVAYERAMLAALRLPDRTAAEIAVRNQAIATARNTLLAAAANKPLTPGAVVLVDVQLGLPVTDPTLGATP